MIITAIRQIKNQNKIFFHISGILCLLAFSMCISLCCPGFGSENSAVDFLLEINTYVLFLGAVILTPILETLIFQVFPYWLLFSVLKTKYRLCIFMAGSSVFFSLFHLYNLPYLFFGLGSGFILSFYYYAGTFRKEGAVFSIAFIHGMNNLLVFLSNDYF
jgi:membrane protease YdiL (CAAX protease family)